MTTTLRGRLVLPDRVLDDGVLVLDGDRIAYAGPASGASVATPPALPGTTLLPGLVDVHNHGGGGAGFPDATSPEEALTAVAAHRSHGTTTLLASLVTADRATLLARAEHGAGELRVIRRIREMLRFETERGKPPIRRAALAGNAAARRGAT